MGDTLQTSALELGKLLRDHNGLKVVVMDMRALNFWTDFFIIATVTSNTHLSGLQRHIKEYTSEKEMEILHRSKKPDKKINLVSSELSSEEWSLMDLGGIVIHLMTARIRNFFELERLWSAAPIIYGETD
jgi:ribosome-associated protein